MHSLITALILAASATPGAAVAGISPTYHHPRWRDVVECPGRSRLALHGECWRKVDVEVVPEQCSQAPTDTGDEDSVRRGNCPAPKYKFG